MRTEVILLLGAEIDFAKHYQQFGEKFYEARATRPWGDSEDLGQRISSGCLLCSGRSTNHDFGAARSASRS